MPRAAQRTVRLFGAEVAWQQVLLERLTQKLGNVPDIEAMHQVEPVNFNGSDTDVEGTSNLSVGMAEGDET